MTDQIFKKSEKKNKFRFKFLTIVLFIFSSCQEVQKDELDIFSPDNDLKKVSVENCKTKDLSPETSRTIIAQIKGIFESSDLVKGREYTKEELFVVHIFNENSEYRIVINQTDNDGVALNYFKKVQDNYYSYYGRNYASDGQFDQLNELLKTHCTN